MERIKEDVISRQKAIDVIFSEPLYETGMKKRSAEEVVPAIFEKIKALPPEQKKGRWVDNTYCSECGWVHETDPGFIGSMDGFNFCPRCGADMRKDN